MREYIKITTIEFLYFIIVNFILMMVPFLYGSNLFYLSIIGFSISFYPFIIANFIFTFFFWKKNMPKDKRILKLIIERVLYLLIAFVLTYLILLIIRKELSISLLTVLFFYLSFFNISFILLKKSKFNFHISALLITFLILTSCNKDKCNNSSEIFGKYENTYEKGAKDLLIIKSDGTFEQIYIKGKVRKSNNGTWKFFKDDCGIYFKTLKLLHNLPAQYTEESIEGQPAKYRNNKIKFYEDIPFEYDYSRVED